MGLNGNHYCGTPTDFTQGGEYLPDLPPAAYDAQGYLVCCAVPEPPPPPPPPNVTCETALPIAIGDVVPFKTLGGVQRWYKFEQDEVGPLKLVTTNDLGLTNVQAIRGDCPPAGIVAEIFFGGCQTFSMTPIGPYRAVVTAFNPGINTGTLSIQRGTC
ncbi:MAG: hypothetical protein DI547_17130 [Sphingobium sp.]|nr:MAG: hypothetical protein DI547_17130 [Sphingobium sp.]